MEEQRGGRERRLTVVDALRRLAASGGDRTALRVDGGPALTCADWERRSSAQASGLLRSGIGPGRRVALVFPPAAWTEYAVTYAAVRISGAVAVPIPADLPAAEAARVVRATLAAAVVTPTGLELPDVLGVATRLSTGVLEELAAGFGESAVLPPAPAPDAPVEILAVVRPLTPPRLVSRTDAETGAARWPVGGRRALVHAFPVGTAAGQDALLAALAHQRLTVVGLPELDTGRAVELLAGGAVDACALHPAAARALLESGPASAAAMTALGLLVVAGDVVPDGLVGRLRDAFPAAAIEVVEEPPAEPSAPSWRDAAPAAPVAVSQEGMLWHECLAPGCQNLPGLARRYRGSLDIEALRRALDELRRRHGALRSSFEIRGGRPVQLVRPHAPLALSPRDLSHLPPGERDAEVARTVADAGRRPFDLVSEPLFQAELLRLAADDHVLVIRTHHTVFDDWSVGVFRRQLAALYAAFAARDAPSLPEPELQFAEVATRERERLGGSEGERAMTFWRRELAGAPLVTQLPVGHPGLPPGSPQPSGDPVALDLPAGVQDGVRSLARREHVTVFMAMLAAFAVLTGRIAGQDDLLLATVVAHRNRAELEGLLGCFTKKIPLRLRLGQDATFLDVLARTRAAVLGAIAHQDPAFDAVLQDALGPAAARHGLVPHAAVMFQGVTPGQDLVLPDVDSAGLGTSMRAPRAHFASASAERPAVSPDPPFGAGLQLGTFVIVSLLDEGGELSCVVRGAFHGPAVRALLDAYGELLAELVAAPQLPLSEMRAAAGVTWGSPQAEGAVDVRGYRVDPVRIEAALADCPGVAAVRVEARRADDGEPELVAHVVAAGTPPTLAELRAWEWSRLPGYAWPAVLHITPADAARAPERSEPHAAVLRATYAAARGVDDVAEDTPYSQDFAFLDALGRARDAGITVPGPLAGRNRTVAALATALAARRLRRRG